MEYSDGIKNYEYFTGKASDVIRQLCLGGFALFWAFKPVDNKAMPIFDALKIPVTILAIGLCADLLQYISGSVLWLWRVRQAEKKSNDDPSKRIEVTQLGNFFWIDIFFYVKIVATLISYIIIVRVLWREFVNL